MTGLIDCHTHLGNPDFDADRAEVIRRARQAGVQRIAVVGQDDGENERVLALAAGRDTLLPFLGLHPDRFADRHPLPPEGLLERVVAQVRQHADRLCGIGEVGLDHWVAHDEQRRELQREALGRLAALARELDLPLNVHSRAAGRRTLDFLLERGAPRVLMHAFDGKAGHALPGAEAGYVFSVPASVVHSPQKRKLVRALPLEALALETDSPVLGPERGVRNEPANVRLALEAIAEIKGVAPGEVARATTATAARLFGLAPLPE